MALRRYEKDLPVTLNTVALAVKAKELANKNLRAVQIERKLKELKDEYHTDKKMLDDSLVAERERCGELARQIRKGEEVRGVMVEARVADDNSRVDIVRTDTGKVIDERPLTEQDRQMEIDDVLARIETDTTKADQETESEEIEEIFDDREDEEPAEDGGDPTTGGS